MANNPKKSDEDQMNEGAASVVKAAEKLSAINRLAKLESLLKAGNLNFDKVRTSVANMDREFDKMTLDTETRQDWTSLENVEAQIRVMQVGLDGKLIDVSDKVNVKDLQPEQVDDVRINGEPLSLTPRTREDALRILKDILPGLKFSNEARDGAKAPHSFSGTRASSTTARSVSRMEAALAESDITLQHWK